MHKLIILSLIMSTFGCTHDPRVDDSYRLLAGEGHAFVMLPVRVAIQRGRNTPQRRWSVAFEVLIEDEDGAQYASAVDPKSALGLQLPPGEYSVVGVRQLQVDQCSPLELSAIPEPLRFDVQARDEIVYAGRLQLEVGFQEPIEVARPVRTASIEPCRAVVVSNTAQSCLEGDVTRYQETFSEVDWSQLKIREASPAHRSPCQSK